MLLTTFKIFYNEPVLQLQVPGVGVYLREKRTRIGTLGKQEDQVNITSTLGQMYRIDL